MYLDFKNLKQSINKLYAIIFSPTIINVLKNYFKILCVYKCFFFLYCIKYKRFNRRNASFTNNF